VVRGDRIDAPGGWSRSSPGVVLETFVENGAGRAFYESRGFTDRRKAGFEVAGRSYPTVVYEKEL